MNAHLQEHLSECTGSDEKGRKVAVQIDLKKYGALLEEFWDGLVSESRSKRGYRSKRSKRTS